MEYSFSFDEGLQQEWEWTEVMAGQPEILRYAEHVAERLALRSDIQFDTKVAAARWEEGEQRWRVTVEGGTSGGLAAQFLVMATGCLSVPNTPAIPGAESFGGPVYHTGRWPHEGVDFAGKRVGVIGPSRSPSAAAAPPVCCPRLRTDGVS